MLSPTYSLKFKNIILFLNRGFSNGQIRNVVSTLPNSVKIDVENDNVVSTLSNVVQFSVEKHNVVSTLFNVVVSTLIWRCATSRRHINPKTTLNRRWNVCWVNTARFYRNCYCGCGFNHIYCNLVGYLSSLPSVHVILNVGSINYALRILHHCLTEGLSFLVLIFYFIIWLQKVSLESHHSSLTNFFGTDVT